MANKDQVNQADIAAEAARRAQQQQNSPALKPQVENPAPPKVSTVLDK